MGKGKNQEHHLLWLMSAMMLLTGLLPFLMLRNRPITELRWIDLIMIGYFVIFTVLHIWIDINGRYIGYKEVIVYSITSSLMVGLVVIFVLVGVDELYLNYEGNRIFSSYQWFLIILFNVLPAIFSGTALAIFGTRDCELGIREVKLPVSIFDQWIFLSHSSIKPASRRHQDAYSFAQNNYGIL